MRSGSEPGMRLMSPNTREKATCACVQYVHVFAGTYTVFPESDQIGLGMIFMRYSSVALALGVG